MDLDNSDTPPIKRKRARISYSCIVCREKRTKCDKNSICSACKNRGTTCQYDTVTQPKPKRPNKDALILRLSKQLEFYKDLACKYTPKEKLSLFNDDIHSIDYALGTRTLKKANIRQDFITDGSNTDNDEEHYILTLKRNDDNFLYDIFTDMYIFKTDDYVNTLFFKKTNTNTTLNSKKDDISIINNLLSNQTFKSEFQKLQSLKFTQALHIENSTKENKEFFNPYSGLFNTFRFDNVLENTIENVIETEPSDLLKNIIILLNRILPSESLIHHYKKLYFETLYPEYPYLDIEFFETTLLEVLHFDNEKVQLNLGKDNIHNKICMIALLLLILYLAIFDENDNKDLDNSIIGDYIGIAMKLLLSTDYLSNPDEHKFSLLCQVWVCLTISPESKYSEDITKKAPTASLVGVITSLAYDLKIGNDTDLDERYHRISNDLRILRRKLSAAYTFITLSEDIFKYGLKGNKKFQNLTHNIDVKSLGSENELENEAYKWCILRNHQYKLIYDIMVMFLKKHPEDGNDEFIENVDIIVLNKKLKLLFEFIDTTFPFDQMQKLSSTDDTFNFPTSSKKYSINKYLVKNRFIMHNWIFSRSVILRILHVVLVSCEYWAFESFNKVANKWFMYYINESLHQSMDLLMLFRKIHDLEYIEYVGSAHSLFQEYIVLYTYSKAFILLLQFIGKCFVFKVYLQMMVMNEKDDSTKLKVEMHLVEEMKDVSSKVIFKALQEYSYLYRFKRYKCFKVCLFLDFFKQIFTDDTLFNTMFETDKKYNLDAPLDAEVCNSTLMRHYLKFYDYLDDFKSMTEYFRSEEIQSYLQKKPFKQKLNNNSLNFNINGSSMWSGLQEIEKQPYMNYPRIHEYPGHFYAQQNISPTNTPSKLGEPIYSNAMNEITHNVKFSNRNINNIPKFVPNGRYVSNFDPNYYKPYQRNGVLGQNNMAPNGTLQFNNPKPTQVNAMNNPQINHMHNLNNNLGNPQMGPSTFMNHLHVNGRSSNPNPMINRADNTPQNGGQSSSATVGSENPTSISATDNDRSNDDFSFEDYLRQLDLQKFDVFGSAFLL
ncbi:hypothetical protein FOG48_00900 [Hanseniaspora uvarum]|nr:hypothetical protein FOG48_00900 [Hanseniaspora uvarum]